MKATILICTFLALCMSFVSAQEQPQEAPPAAIEPTPAPPPPPPPPPPPQAPRMARPSAPPTTPSGPAPLVEIAFEKDVYDRFDQWIKTKTPDDFLLMLMVPSNREGVRNLANWLKSDVLNHPAPAARGRYLVLTLSDGGIGSGSGGGITFELLREYVQSIMTNFNEEILVPETGKVQRQEQEAEREQREAKQSELRAEIDALTGETGVKLQGRNAQKIAEGLQNADDKLRSLAVEIAENSARLKTLQASLTEEKPVVQRRSSEGVIPLVREQLLGALTALEQKGKQNTPGDPSESVLQDTIRKLAEAVRTSPSQNVEEINPIYTKLKEMLITTESQLAGITARQEALKGQRQEMEQALVAAYEIEAKRGALERELAKIEATPPRRPAPAPVRRPPGPSQGGSFPKMIFPDTPGR